MRLLAAIVLSALALVAMTLAPLLRAQVFRSPAAELGATDGHLPALGSRSISRDARITPPEAEPDQSNDAPAAFEAEGAVEAAAAAVATRPAAVEHSGRAAHEFTSSHAADGFPRARDASGPDRPRDADRMQRASAVRWAAEPRPAPGVFERAADRPDQTAAAGDAATASQAAFRAAAQAMQSGQWLVAIEQLGIRLADRPDDARAWYNLAICRGELRQLTEARRAWDHYLALRARDADAYARRAEVLLDLREDAQAAADYDTVRTLLAADFSRISPGAAVAERTSERPRAARPTAAVSLDVTMNHALALERLGRGPEARRMLLEHLACEPENVLLMNRLAGLAWRMAQAAAGAAAEELYQEAERWCAQSLAVAPRQPAAQALRAEMRRGR